MTILPPLVLFSCRLTILFLAILLLSGDTRGSRVQAQQGPTPTATLAAAPLTEFVGASDSNSPAVWDLIDGRPTLHVVNSIDGRAELSAGRNHLRLQPVDEVKFSTAAPPGGVWMEAVIEDDVDTWYGYYHNEVASTACPGERKVAPRIGAARSQDHGRTWEDLGPILEMPAHLMHCDTSNHYFVGGVGDFSAVLDADKEYLYFFYTQYVERDGGVGVALGRMPWASRDKPAGALAVWHTGAWLPAQVSTVPRSTLMIGFVYDVATPVYIAQHRWDEGDGRVNVWWGPSVHWNTFLGSYVMLLNQAVSNEWQQGGVYIAFLPDLTNPKTWSAPTLLHEGGEWYPQVLGLAPGVGTDKLAGETARFYMGGKSDYVIRFAKP